MADKSLYTNNFRANKSCLVAAVKARVGLSEYCAAIRKKNTVEMEEIIVIAKTRMSASDRGKLLGRDD